MSVLCVKLIEAQTPDRFERALWDFLGKFEPPNIDMHSIRVSLAVTPGLLYTATVTWLDIEDDRLEAPVLSRSETGLSANA